MLNQATPEIELCGSNFGYLRFSLQRWLAEMTALELQNIELWAASPHLYVGDASVAAIRQLRHGIEAHELRLRCFTPEQIGYPINVAAPEPEIRTRSIAYLERALAICAALECPLLLLVAGRGYAGEPEADMYARAADSLAKVVARAEREGVLLAVEALQPFESNIVNSASEVSRLLDQVGSPTLGVAIDTVAMAVAGDTVANYTERFAGRIRHCHFIDGSPSGHLAWPDGSLPMRRYLTELLDGGYQGMLSMEILNRRYWRDPSEPLRRSRDLVSRALAEIVERR